jgi:hypothetical protein
MSDFWRTVGDVIESVMGSPFMTCSVAGAGLVLGSIALQKEMIALNNSLAPSAPAKQVLPERLQLKVDDCIRNSHRNMTGKPLSQQQEMVTMCESAVVYVDSLYEQKAPSSVAPK